MTSSPSAQRHRGPHPEDRRLFAPTALPKLRAACTEVSWLLGRGYRMDPALRAVCEHHQLDTRQRLAVQRSACSTQQERARRDKSLSPQQAAGGAWAIDGFNLIITLEVALSSGVLLSGQDGALRDLAGLRGSYHPIAETTRALDLLGDATRRYQPPAVWIWLDAPVANSGRLRERIMECSASWPCPVVINLVPNADLSLAGSGWVISSDSVVLDSCTSWINLASWLLAEQIPSAWVIDLAGE